MTEIPLSYSPDNLPGELDEKIDYFYDLLITANKRCNLTRITTRDDFLNKHVLDSLLIASVYPQIKTEPLSIIDIGCGGGIPGLILAMAFPQINIVEIDSVAKKIDCVQSFINDLGLSNAQAFHANARELSRKDGFNQSFDLVTARAVAESHKLIKECRLFMTQNGKMIFYKTPGQISDEQVLVIRESAKAKLEAERSAVLDLTEAAGQRQFWIISRKPQS